MDLDTQTVSHHPQWGTAPAGARPVPHPPGLHPPGPPGGAPPTPSTSNGAGVEAGSAPGPSIPYSAPATLNYTKEEGRGEQWAPAPTPSR